LNLKLAVTAMVKEKSQKPTLALALDDAAKLALCAAAKAIETSPEEWLGVSDITFEPESQEHFQMAFVLFNDRLCHLPSESLQTLHDDIRRHVASLVAEELQALTCRGLELFGPDRSHLIARFRASSQLMSLRRAIWRSCKEFGTAFPDARWDPHIRLGRIKASRGQLRQVSLSKLPTELSQLAIAPSGLTLLGTQPQDPYCDCNWDIVLPACAQQPGGKAAPPIAVAAMSNGKVPEVSKETAASATDAPAEAERAVTAPCTSGGSLADSAAAPRGFVAELPRLRRPAGEPSWAGRRLVSQ